MLYIFMFFFPFMIFFGLIFFFLSFFFCYLNFSVLLIWNMVFSSFNFSLPIYMDFISCSFLMIVLFISGSIFLYSNFYMEDEIYTSRFFFLMLLFIISMIFLIMIPNMFFMLLGWDGLGLISFCLVIFYQSSNSFSSGMITFLSNRVGDSFLLMSLSLYFFFGDFNYMNFLTLKDFNSFVIFFFLASLTKSAQFPFSAWLPAAMAAPTPVSSLVHSSTLVTSGIYILMRFNYYLYDNLKFFLLVFSLLTMLTSGMVAMLEYDLKKIIAFSTLSQLGFMMSTLSMNLIDLTFFHLVCHASFKALLFMCAGFLIHCFFGNQDIRFFGNLSMNYFLTFSMFSVSSICLCGFPFLSAFFSKDLILELVIKKKMNLFIFFMLMFGTCLTVSYSFRLLYYMMFKNIFVFSSVETVFKSFYMQLSMFFLFFLTLFFGFLFYMYMVFPYDFIILPLKMKFFVNLICLLSFFFSYNFSYLYFFAKKFFIIFIFNMFMMNYIFSDFLKKLNFFFSNIMNKLILNFTEIFIPKSYMFYFISLKMFLIQSIFIYLFFLISFIFFLKFMILIFFG